MLNFRTFFVSLVIFVLFGLFTVNTFAASPQPSTIPGWGFGDPNHTHTGPPPFSIRPITGPQDVPAFRASLQQYLADLRSWIQGFMS